MGDRTNKHNNPDWFIKFPSIDNHYQNKIIYRWSNSFPEMTSDSFIVTEKLDGSQMQIRITADDIGYASRNKTLQIDESFFDWQAVLIHDDVNSVNIRKLQNFIKQSPDVDSLNIYGEIYGEGVQKRIEYGKGKSFLPFEIRVNDEILPIAEAHQLLKDNSIYAWWTPIVGIFDNFEDAFAVTIDSRYTEAFIGDIPDLNLDDTSKEAIEARAKYEIEGVVIAPYSKVYKYDQPDGGESVFRLKHKCAKFNDKMKVKTKEVVIFEGSPEYVELQNVWSGMINENRVLDMFSKEGAIQDPKDIGKYIKLIMEDVKADFFKEHKDAFIKLNDAERKRIISSSSKEIVPLLREHL